MNESNIVVRKPQIGDTIPAKKRFEDVDLTMFVKDDYGALRCNGHRKNGFIPKSVKPKVVIYSELEAWRVARIMINKEKENGTFNAKVPMGPVKCNAGFPHWHLGHSKENVGRKPRRVIRIQLFIEKVDDWFKRISKKMQGK